MDTLQQLINKNDKFYFGLLIFIAITLLIVISFDNFLLFHSIVELLSVFIAFSITVIVYHSGKRNLNNYLIILGAAYFFVGGFDFLHTFSYKGMNIMGNFGSNLPTQLWIIGRYLESSSLAMAFWFYQREKVLDFNKVFLYYGALTIVIGLTLYFNIFPTCHIEGVGLTPFKKVSEYIIAIILVMALYFLKQNKHKFEQKTYQLLGLSIILTIISELAFTFYVDVYGISNIIGHIFKILSFLIIYEVSVKNAIIKPQNIIFDQFKRAKERFELGVKAANLGVWYWDYKTDEVIYDKHWAKMLHFKLIDLEFNLSTWKKLIHPEDKTKVAKKIQAIIHGDKNIFEVEYRLKTRLGQYKWIRSVGRIIERDDEGEIKTIAGINQDIDDEVKSNRQLIVEQNNFTQIFENVQQAMVLMNEYNKVININEHFSSVFKFKKDECIGKHINELFAEEDYYRLLSSQSKDQMTIQTNDQNEITVEFNKFQIHLMNGAKGSCIAFKTID